MKIEINYTSLIRLTLTASIISLCNIAQAQLEPLKTSPGYDTVKAGSWKQMQGSKVANTKYGDVNIRIYAYVRYLNQMGLDSSYTNAFGQTSSY